MLKQRFSVISDLIKDGTIQIISRDANGRVELKIPKMYWMQLTPNDVWSGIQGRFLDPSERKVEGTIFGECDKEVHVVVYL